MRRSAFKYIPLDDILEQPGTRLLRALRWFDWVTSNELFAAAGVPDFVCQYKKQNTERNAASAALSRLVRDGYVERRGDRQIEGYPHRITRSGRAELKRRLRGRCAASRAHAGSRRAA